MAEVEDLQAFECRQAAKRQVPLLKCIPSSSDTTHLTIGITGIPGEQNKTQQQPAWHRHRYHRGTCRLQPLRALTQALPTAIYTQHRKRFSWITVRGQLGAMPRVWHHCTARSTSAASCHGLGRCPRAYRLKDADTSVSESGVPVQHCAVQCSAGGSYLAQLGGAARDSPCWGQMSTGTS